MRYVRTIAIVFALCLCQVGIAQQAQLKDFLPRTSDADLQAFFDDASVQWYDVQSRPPIFQHRGQFHSIYEDIGPRGPRFSNGNGEWPWSHPSTPTNDGRTKNIVGVRLAGVQEFRVSFPQTEISRTYLPSGVKIGYVPAGSHPGVGWQMGDGSDIVELVTNRIAGGDYVFKVHRMTKQNGEWVFRVYRPFTDSESYEQATNTKPVYVGSKRMRSQHTIAAFDQTRDVWEVPRIEPALARKLLLTTNFKLAEDDEFIPTTRFTDQVYPQGYLGAYIGNAIDQNDCRRCHQHVAEGVRKFDSGEWYGQIRGGAKDKHGVGVFSWYPDRFLRR